MRTRSARSWRCSALDTGSAEACCHTDATQDDGLAIQWVLADAEALPFADDRLKERITSAEENQ